MLISTRSTLRSPMLISSASQDRGGGGQIGETGSPPFVAAVWQIR